MATIILIVLGFAMWPVFIGVTVYALHTKDKRLSKIVAIVWVVWMIVRTLLQLYFGYKWRFQRERTDIPLFEQAIFLLPDVQDELEELEEPGETESKTQAN